MDLWTAVRTGHLAMMVILLPLASWLRRGLAEPRPLPPVERLRLQRDVLSALGLARRPRPPHGHEDPPGVMLNLYRASGSSSREVAPTLRAAEETLLNGTDMVVSLANTELQDWRNSASLKTRLRFDLSHVASNHKLTLAELWLYKEPAEHAGEGEGKDTFLVSVHRDMGQQHAGTYTLSELERGLENMGEIERKKGRVRKITYRSKAKEGKGQTNETVMHSCTVFASEEVWIALDITKVSAMSETQPHKIINLWLSVETPAGKAVHLANSGLQGSLGMPGKRPFMIAFFQSTSATDRHTLRSLSHQSHANHNNWHNTQSASSSKPLRPPRSLGWGGDRRPPCRLQEMYVSFRDLGWQDWIIAPKGYAAFYCDGECSFPLGAHMNATNHAIVQALIHLMKPEAVPKPCCAPTKLNAISILYFDNKRNVILKKYQNMVAHACGCH